MAYTGPGYPNWLADEYPGMGGINTALKGYSYLLNDPGFKQLTEASASDPEAQQYQAGPMAGVPSSAAPGLFGRLMAANMGANVAGQAAQNQGQNAAQKERVQAGSDTANLMAGQQESELQLRNAQTQQALDQLMMFGRLITKGPLLDMFSNIMASGPKGPTPTTAPNFSGATPTGDAPPPLTEADQTASSVYSGAASGMSDATNPTTTTHPGLSSWSPGLWSSIMSELGMGA